LLVGKPLQPGVKRNAFGLIAPKVLHGASVRPAEFLRPVT
jgi:hypothetical protein